MKATPTKAPAIILVLALAVSGCSANVNTTPVFDAQLPAFEVTGSPSPVEPFTSFAAVGTDAEQPVVPLQHKENPTHVPIGAAAVVVLFVAAALLFLPSIITSVGDTSFDSSSDPPIGRHDVSPAAHATFR